MSKRKRCPQCDGSGSIGREVDEQGVLIKDCGVCKGLGYIGGKRPKKVKEKVYEYIDIDIKENIYFEILRICIEKHISIDKFILKSIKNEMKIRSTNG
jgi:RecJ-like exonuclease